MSHIYGDIDPRELPLYGQREAAHFLRISPSTLRGWISEREGTAIIRLSDPEGRRLSFNNLVEAYVLRTLRTKHEVSIPAIRRAVAHVEEKLNVQRLLLREELRVSGDLFWEALSGELVNLSQSGQLAMRDVLESYLNRIEWDRKTKLPKKLFPRVESDPEAKVVVIDPRVAFGQPTMTGTGVSTAIVAARIDAGEEPERVAEDYGVAPEWVRKAVVYEAAG